MLMPEPHHSRHDQYVESYSNTGEAKILRGGRELLGRRKDGSTVPIYLAVSEVTLKDRRIFTVIVRDISELKQAEEAIRERAVQLRTIFKIRRSVLRILAKTALFWIATIDTPNSWGLPVKK
jgi:PAS domain-containing protein